MTSSNWRYQAPSSSASSIISDTSADVSLEEANVRNFVKKCLSKRLFLGHYQERRYVDNLGVYRDMVVLHKSETELQVDCDRVISKLISFYHSDKWLGITSPGMIGAPAAGHSFWTKLQDVAFGFYWFQIRQIRFEEREIVVRLKVIRPVDEEVVAPPMAPTSFTKSFSENIDSLKTHIRTSVHSLKECNQTPLSSTPNANQESSHMSSKSTTDGEISKDNPEPEKPAVSESLKMEDVKCLWRAAMRNWIEIFTFLTMVIVGTLNGLGKCVECVGNFSLKLMHEVTYLVHTITPIILAVIELVGKTVGGFYLILAMLFRQHGPPPRQHSPPPRQLMPPLQNRRPPAIRYNNYPPRARNRQ